MSGTCSKQGIVSIQGSDVKISRKETTWETKTKKRWLNWGCRLNSYGSGQGQVACSCGGTVVFHKMLGISLLDEQPLDSQYRISVRKLISYVCIAVLSRAMKYLLQHAIWNCLLWPSSLIISCYNNNAVGLSPGDSTHLHTNNTQNNTNNNRTTQITNNVEEYGPCPVFASFYPGICLTTGGKSTEKPQSG
jgi:hypothetical protein